MAHRKTTQTFVRFSTFPETAPPPLFVLNMVNIFRKHESAISTTNLVKGLESNQVLATIGPDLEVLGFTVEKGKLAGQKIPRPVFYGENGQPSLEYQIDAYQPAWRCGLEVEAGRAWMGNAIYRDLIQAMVMVDVDVLVLAVPVAYKYNSGGKPAISPSYSNTYSVVRALYGHRRITMPYSMILIGY